MRDQRDSHEPVAPLFHRRSSLRLPEFDYSTAGAYFVTICTIGKACLFGEVVDGGVSLTAAGSMVESTWSQMPHHYPTVQIDAFVVMPNHIHGIIFLTDGQAWEPATTSGLATAQDGQAWEPATTDGPITTPGPGSEPAPTFGLSDTIHRFKSLTTRRFADLGHSGGHKPQYPHLWQRNYYEHVIRDYDSLQRIREYIVNNPLAWELDRENPSAEFDAARIPTTDTWQV